MLDHRRHVPLALVRRSSGRESGRESGRAFKPRTYRGRAHKTLRDLYEADHAEARHGGRFRWLISTCVAAAVGAVAILVVIFGSNDPAETTSATFTSALRKISQAPLAMPAAVMRETRDGGLRWAAPKTNRLVTVSGANSTRFVIHDTLKQRRNGHEYIVQKPYIRIVSRLAPVPKSYADVIPPFNPFKLYASNQPVTAAEEEGANRTANQQDVSIKVVELLGGILPGEDGQELETSEVSDLVERTRGADVKGEPLDALDPVVAPAASGPARNASARDAKAAADALAPNTTQLAKASGEGDDPAEETDSRDVRVVKVARGETLVKILGRAGADSYQAAEMAKSAAAIFPESALLPGQEVQITLVPSLLDASRLEPSQFSVFADGHEHKVTVARSSAGEFVASATLAEAGASGRLAESGEAGAGTSVYASIYGAGLYQSLPPETIKQILRVHAYDADYRRRVRTGDQVESFFDAKDEAAADGPPGEMLFTALTIAGDTSRFWRFRSDGVVDYYDEKGNNSKKFLMRKPLRGDDVRLVSGFGMRFHPLLNERRMHTGVDWASPTGSPIVAAGNGVVEEAGRKGGYGNYLRIKHANGYQTAYGHISRYASGLSVGSKVRQGQIIAYVGCTGLCEGPHVHFEILVNNRFVDPLSIQVPRERQLTGQPLAEFQKERARIDELMRRAPVMTAAK